MSDSFAGAALTKPSSSTSTTVSPGATKSPVKDNPKETFMKLLVAQLEHQNPLSPMDNMQFTQQLAQFSSLEQLQTMNTNLSALMSAQTATNGLQAAALIGKDVRTTVTSTHVPKSGAPSPFQYTLSADSAKVAIVVLDKQGNPIRTINHDKQKAGVQSKQWDGKDIQGRPLPEGDYQFIVTAADGLGRPIQADAAVQGVIEGVQFEAKQPYVIVQGNRIDISAITEIKQPVK